MFLGYNLKYISPQTLSNHKFIEFPEKMQDYPPIRQKWIISGEKLRYDWKIFPIFVKDDNQ